MLSGEGNGLISKKNNFARAAHFFLQFFAVVLHDYNAKLPETLLWRKCRTCSRSFFFISLPLIFSLHCWPLFFTAAHFLLALLAASISHFVTTATKFSFCSSNKKSLLCFLSLTLDLCRAFSRWVSPACRLLSLFLCLSLALYSRFACGHDN